MSCRGCQVDRPEPMLCTECAQSDVLQDTMLADLIVAEIVIIAAQDRVMITDGRTDLPIGVYVLASDTFAYACADAEPLNFDQIPVLYCLWHAHGYAGVNVWLVRQRRMRPIQPIVQSLQRAGLWDELEALCE